MNFTKNQERAYKAHGKNVIVSAGAGSGKTQVLTERVRYLIQEKGYDIRQFLILTFTELAAGEMKERIRKKLITFDHDQASLIDNAAICTFDSYALSIVKRYHNLLNLDKNITVLDNNIVTIIIDNEIDKIIDELSEKGDKDFVSLINRFCFKDFQPIKDIIHDIYNACKKSSDENKYIQDLLNNDGYLITLNLLKQYESRLDEYEQNIEDLYYELMEDKIDKITSFFLKYHQASSLDEKAAFFKNIRFPNIPSDSDENLHVEITSLKEKLKSMTKSYTSEKIIIDESVENKKHLITIVNIVKHLLNVDRRYKFEHQAFCFNDIAKMAIEILANYNEVCQEIKDQIKIIMIDEYQDTSLIQETFINLIAQNNVYQVGDVKQSIYRFRDATPEIFIKKFNDYKSNKGGEMISLNDNFRSRKEVIDDINKIFSKIMSEDLGGANYVHDHLITSGNILYETIGKNKENHHLTILNYEENSDKLYEAHIIAQDIIKKINNGYEVFDGKNIRKAKFSDFCILMDRGTSFLEFQRVFTEYNIPLFIESNVDISKNEIILALTNMLRLIKYIENNDYNGRFRHAFLSLGRSFIYCLSDEELFNIIQNNAYSSSEIVRDLIYLIEKNKHTSIYDIILDFISYKKIYHRLVLIGDIEVYEKYLDDFIDSLSNLHHLDFDLDDYINYFDKVKELELKVDVKSSSTSFNSVKMMNIFKSKGLEFPIVYCAGLYKKFNRDEFKKSILLSKKYGVMFPDYRLKKSVVTEMAIEEEVLEDLSEKIRLLYVALTRAKEKIICLLPKTDKMVPVSLQDSGNLADILYVVADKFEMLNIKKEEDISLVQPKEKTRFINLTYQEYNFVHKEKEIIKSASKTLSLSTDDSILKIGERLHFELEMIDFLNPDYQIINLEDYKYIHMFINSSLIKNLKQPIFYKEYEFLDDVSNHRGIIDLLVIDGNNAYIIDYKLKNIADEEYRNQLYVYYQYVANYFKLKARCYLYSILTGDTKEYDFNDTNI